MKELMVNHWWPAGVPARQRRKANPAGVGGRPAALTLGAALLVMSGAALAGETGLDIGARRQLFVDHHVIERMDGTSLVMGSPRDEGEVLRLDRPWEGPGSGYYSVMKDGDLYRLYYRGLGTRARGEAGSVTCYAESRDGHRWTRPALGLHEFDGSTANNIILLHDEWQAATNFAAFLDHRPEVPRAERFKAVGGTRTRGLMRYVSEDGIRWRRFSDEPLFAGYVLDSLNVVTWCPADQVYAIYLRGRSDGTGTPEKEIGRGMRSVRRAVSKDFVNWSKPVLMDFGDTPVEHIYVNNTLPYFRAPHIMIALAGRYWQTRDALPQDVRNAMGVYPDQAGISDVVLMTSRGGPYYDRTFMESFLRPGPDPRGWTARNNYPGFGIVPTGVNEMSFYASRGYASPENHMRRYSLRLDGFSSVRAGYAQGYLLTKPLKFAGDRLILNCATSAAGSIQVELTDAFGVPLDGFSARDCDTIIGDDIGRVVTWKGRADFKAISGKPTRIRFVMKDADIYSFQFAHQTP